MPDNSPRRTAPKLLLVGAGETEIGRPAGNDSSKPDLKGAALPHLLDKLLPPQKRRYEVAMTKKFDLIQRIPRQQKLRSLDADKIQSAMFLADLKQLDGIVVLIDRESKSQPDRAARMRKGREQYRKVNGKGGPACAVGAACRSLETWLLADPQARTEVFGKKAGNPFSRDPEDRPDPRALKTYIKKWAATKNMAGRKAYEPLAKSARPAQLKRLCPTSYAPFAKEVKAEIAPLSP